MKKNSFLLIFTFFLLGLFQGNAFAEDKILWGKIKVSIPSSLTLEGPLFNYNTQSESYGIKYNPDPWITPLLIVNDGTLASRSFDYNKKLIKLMSTGGKIIKEKSTTTNYEIVYSRADQRVFTKIFQKNNTVYRSNLIVGEDEITNSIIKNLISAFDSISYQDNITPKPTPKPPVKLDNSNMVWIQGGKGDFGDSVKSFWISKYETTWATWKKVRSWSTAKGYDIGNVPILQPYNSYDQVNRLDKNPVYGITWYEAVKWCNAKSEMEGLTPVYTIKGSVYRRGESIPTVSMSANGYRLPSDAEWKYAATGGLKSKGYNYSGSNKINEVAWYDANTGTNYVYKLRAVGLKKPNELGLYDMSGNVSEWCNNGFEQDSESPYYDPYYVGRIVNGGSWGSKPENIDLDITYSIDANSSSDDWGFRIIRY